MTTLHTPIALPLFLTEGFGVYSAFEALLKGCLEADLSVDLLLLPREPVFSPVLELAAEERHAALFKRHGLVVNAVPTAARAVRLAFQAAAQGGYVVVLVSNEQMDAAIAEVAAARDHALDQGGVLLVVEDDPDIVPWLCPRVMSGRLGLACLEPADLAGLRSSIEQGLRLSRTSRRPSVSVVHRQLWHTIETLPGLPNRVHDAADVQAMLRRRKRRIRLPEGDDLLRIARRMELSRLHNLPSPGERVGVGFIMAGPASLALQHLLFELRLGGRIPLLELGLVRPLDPSVLRRFLERCEDGVVLETRPGSITAEVLEVAEQMRRAGERPAVLWGRRLPPDDEGESPHLLPGEALSPSVLARKILHLLHRVRPGRQVAQRLVSTEDRAAVDALVERLEHDAGDPQRRVRRVWEEVRAWAGEHPTNDPELSPPGILVAERESTANTDRRLVMTEWWTSAAFLRNGAWAIRQAALERRSRLFLVLDLPRAEAGDHERLARAALPGDTAQPVFIEAVGYTQTDRLRELLRQACRREGVHVIVVREGGVGDDQTETAPRAAEIDRLGFEPVQRWVRRAEDACSLRPPAVEEPATASLALPEAGIRMDRLPARARRQWRLRLRPRYEIVDVVRSKPPVARMGDEQRGRPPIPTILHAKQPVWRAHIAGSRGGGAGIIARVLIAAGRDMRFHVRARYQPESGIPGAHAWSQVLFTHPREDEPAPPLTAQIPWAEADLLLGVDPVDTLRTLGNETAFRITSPGRTHALVDLGGLRASRVGEEASDPRSQAQRLLQACTQPAPALLGDVSRACRTAFGTDRLVDFVLLGAAFQFGLIPVTVEAIERAVARAQEEGFGRSSVAFEFGRRLAIDPRPLERAREEQQEPIHLLARRSALTLRRKRYRGEVLAAAFRAVWERARGNFPGLFETEDGREACRDLATATHRCLLWGGPEYARRYHEILGRIYESDRGDRGRAVTVRSILPLAEAMLVRDNLYLARTATSLEHRQRMRAGLRIRLPRGDELTRRYLNRLELLAFGRRVRFDFISSDWTAYAVRFALASLPERWRGSRFDRARKSYLMEFFRRLPEHMDEAYETIVERLKIMQGMVIDGRLHRVSARGLRTMLEPSLEGRDGVDEDDLTPDDDAMESETGSWIAQS